MVLAIGQDLQSQLSATFADAGFAVTIVADGAELTAACTEPPQLVVLDTALAGGRPASGWLLTLRAQPVLADVPVLLLIEAGDEDAVPQGTAHGATDSARNDS
jgi:DNA-binding response OmpR family regulator